MVNLEVEDQKQLITLLKDLPELATERSLRLVLAAYRHWYDRASAAAKQIAFFSQPTCDL